MSNDILSLFDVILHSFSRRARLDNIGPIFRCSFNEISDVDARFVKNQYLIVCARPSRVVLHLPRYIGINYNNIVAMSSKNILRLRDDELPPRL